MQDIVILGFISYNRNCSLVWQPVQVLQESLALNFSLCPDSLLLAQIDIFWYRTHQKETTQCFDTRMVSVAAGNLLLFFSSFPQRKIGSS
jgi:hypothetical protein